MPYPIGQSFRLPANHQYRRVTAVGGIGVSGFTVGKQIRELLPELLNSVLVVRNVLPVHVMSESAEDATTPLLASSVRIFSNYERDPRPSLVDRGVTHLVLHPLVHHGKVEAPTPRILQMVFRERARGIDKVGLAETGQSLRRFGLPAHGSALCTPLVPTATRDFSRVSFLDKVENIPREERLIKVLETCCSTVVPKFLSGLFLTVLLVAFSVSLLLTLHSIGSEAPTTIQR
jgi:hypothetical protein